MTDSNYQKLEIEQIDHKIEIPNNKLAKLLYYLECVFTVIQSDLEKKYINYFYNDLLLSKEEEETILDLVSKFNSKVMLELNLFVIEPDFVPIDKENEFYDIDDERFEGKVNLEVVIGELTRKVLKIMACNQSWIDKYYFEPLKEYENQQKVEIKEEKEIKEYKNLYKNIYINNIYNRKMEKECRCCFTTCRCCCECDCDGYCERCCCCCGCHCPYISVCGNSICPDRCSCYCVREFFSGMLACIIISLICFYVLSPFISFIAYIINK